MMAVDRKDLERAAEINLDRAWIASDRAANRSAIQNRFLSTAKGNDESKREWFVIRTAVKSDSAVHKLLLDAGIQSWLPRYTKQMAARKSAPKIVKTLHACEGYLFVFVVPGPESWAGILGVKGVEKILGNGKQPVSIDEKRVNKFMHYLLSISVKEGDKAEFVSPFEPGETVRVTDGPFASFMGLIVECFESGDMGKVRVEANIFGRLTPVEMDLDQIEKV